MIRDKENARMKILIVEEHKILLESLTAMVSSAFKTSTVIPVLNIDLADRFLHYDKEIDVLLVSLDVKNVGVEWLQQVNRNIGIVVTNKLYSSFLLNRLQMLNVLGFLTHHSSKADYIKAIALAKEKKVFVAKEVEIALQQSKIEMATLQQQKKAFVNKVGFTQRELDIINLMMSSKTNKEIAEELFLSADTVKFHRKNIYKKAEVDNLLDLYKLLEKNNFF